ncbi:MAG: sigma-54 dependent transcriptional regulator [Desulfarculaceae bacterium]|jgi:two-component system NtrC family response regulator
MAEVLIIDDDQHICQILARHIQRLGHNPTTASYLHDGLQTAKSQDFDVIFLDVTMPDGNGLEVLPELRQTTSSPEIIIITGSGSQDGAELAIKNGAWAYVEKGDSINSITLPLTRALQFRQEKMTHQPQLDLNQAGIIGNSPAMRACYNLLAQAAASELSVLITGETGTGKELFARAIHQNCRRSAGGFVVVDCAALPETLVESILFGYERGAFTGADRSREGLIKQAHGGTLFLDEIGELPLSMQKSFLRVLQDHSFRPVGGTQELNSDFRLVAATNRNLDKMEAEGRFRKDLLFRIRALSIHVPPLRERMQDLRDLVEFHTHRLCKRYNISDKEVTPGFFEALANYTWPGNVRELVAALEQAIAAAGTSPTLFQNHLPELIRVAVARSRLGSNGQASEWEGEPIQPARPMPTLRQVVQLESDQAERKYLRQLMNLTQGDIKKACEIAGLGRSSLYTRLKKHGISRKG